MMRQLTVVTVLLSASPAWAEPRNHAKEALASQPASVSCDGHMMRTAYYSVSSGRATASGSRFDPNAMTAAHRTLPFGTKLTIRNPRNGKSVTVIVNDRGPFNRGLQLDLSRGAARAVGMAGIASLCVM